MISEDIQKENERFERYKERVTNFSNNFEIGLFIYLLKKSFIIYILIFATSTASGYLYLRYTDPIYESNLIMQKHLIVWAEHIRKSITKKKL